MVQTICACSHRPTVDFQVNDTIMLSIVTDPEMDYIFVTDFDVLEEHLDNILQQACRTVSTSTTSTYSTPSTSITTSATVTGPGESTLQSLNMFCTGVLKKL